MKRNKVIATLSIALHSGVCIGNSRTGQIFHGNG